MELQKTKKGGRTENRRTKTNTTQTKTSKQIKSETSKKYQAANSQTSSQIKAKTEKEVGPLPSVEGLSDTTRDAAPSPTRVDAVTQNS